MAEEEKKATEENENEKTNSLKEWIEKHPKTFFCIRGIFWFIFSCGLPFAFIAWRYGIFTSQSKIKLTGWGMIAIIIAIVFIITLIKYLYKGLKPGLAKQCIFGFVSIILPLVILYLLIISIQSDIDLFKQALGCVIICELVGIPLNPFPAWVEQKRKERKEEEASSLSDIVLDKFFKKKKEEEK
jgi:hypothetical protein